MNFVSKDFELQIELSTNCNALCLGCVRTDQENFNEQKKYIPKNKKLNLEDLYKRICELNNYRLTAIEFCGNIDEPLLHPDFLSLLENLSQSHKHLFISIHTNGSIHNRSYFSKLATTLSNFSRHELRFSIDGINDTLSIYRQKCSYDKVISNAESFIDSGGYATWQFICFPWNKHQVEDAQSISEVMGFKKFLLRKDRSMDTNTLAKLKSKKNENFQVQKNKNFDPSTFSSTCTIECVFKKNNLLFLSWDFNLWPCCFMANIFYESNFTKISSFTDDFYMHGAPGFNNLNNYSFEDIFKEEPFASRLINGWTNTEDRMWRCSEKCSTRLEKKSPIKKLIFN